MNNNANKMAAADRQAQILAAALVVAQRVGFNKFTLREVAQEAKVTEKLPSHYFGTMTNLRRKVMREAVKQKILPLIAQGIALNDPHALKVSPELRAAALKSLA